MPLKGLIDLHLLAESPVLPVLPSSVEDGIQLPGSS